MRWSLDELYTGFDSKEYTDDLKLADKLTDDFVNWATNDLKGDPRRVIEAYIDFSIKTNTIYSKLMSYSRLTLSVDSNNGEATREDQKLRMKAVKLTEPNVKFQKYIKNIDNLDEIIGSSKLLMDHEFVLKELKASTKYILSEEEEVLYGSLKNTGSNAWTDLQNSLTSNLTVDLVLDGQEESIPLPAARNLAYSGDANTRKTAYYAELASYEKIAASSAAALNGIKGEVITMNNTRGYANPLEETLLDSRMEKETLDSMLAAMVEFLPIFHKYFKQKAKILGHQNGLPFYDLFAPIGNMSKEFSFQEANDYIVSNFRTFSDDLADFADNAFKSNWIDGQPRPGKRGGAFCSSLHPIGQSRIMANYDGSFSNLITLAHELGHGYHGYNLKDESILNSSYPMPIAETASIFCETIVMNAALKEASSQEAIGLLESSISDASQVIVDIYSRYLFETELFERRKSGTLSVEDLKEMMLDAQRKSYGEGLDENFLHPYMWVNKTHYYSAGRNFYNFPYAFGLLFSKGLYAEYLESKDGFTEKYRDLLNATGRKNIVDVAKMMNININDPEFFRNSLKLIEKDIELFIELTK